MSSPKEKSASPGHAGVATPEAAAAGGEAIEAGSPADIEDDEFATSDFDASSTASTSVTSSIFQHSYENGRRYHQYKNGRYPIPNDDTEQAREDMKHALMLELTNGKLTFADIGDNPQNILDLGTGTGIWAIDIADQYPSAQVQGVDLSPIQPSYVPPNVKFVIDDVEDEWLHGDNFDLVHMRQMAPILKNVRKVIQDAFPHIRDGGWIEIQEFGGEIMCDDGTVKPESSLVKFFDLCTEAMTKFGSDFRIGNKIGPMFEEAGYTNVSCVTIKTPIGTWPKDPTLRLCGMYMTLIMSDLMSAMGAKPLTMLGMSREEIEVFLAQARRDVKDPSQHAYLNYRFWTGQKPGGK